ncbi:glycoside hydrolase family 10 protein [Sandaracinus amylolyticus]|uniref:glycoside hydrolase family 10 protein n=1 Tax=Sandaracinus amylolyticus TaxID=927083 RepID=UPI001F2AFEB6|nr:family 10 glycosylhydrolase [Sandaracinus amylolyticus]UJR81081.1 Glycosyl hydrolase [Sandaracinus amylolyticus]
MARTATFLALSIALTACSSSASPLDAGLDGAQTSEHDAQTSEPDAPIADPTLIALEHTRELRGVWAPSVYNLAFPSRTGLTRAQIEAEITRILDTLESMRGNAVFLQIRPESDALYASEIEPWSRFLTGTQGGDPGFDPLAMWLERAHARGIEVHAWMNPYRGMTSTSITTAENHVTRTLAEHTRTVGSILWLDPGAPEVRQHIVRVVRDVVARYDVDGIHFDDYFYPYPGSGTLDDSATYEAYRDGGGTLERSDWRRQNVHDLVREVSVAIAELRDDVRFGISPFGIYRPGMPPGITGLDAYEAISCDPLPWIENGWVDYVAPQLYWPTTQTAQDFDRLIEWWAGRAQDGRTILAGMNVVGIEGDDDRWTSNEFEAEMDAVHLHLGRGVSGSIAYTVRPFLTNHEGITDLYRDELWISPALTGPLASADPTTRPAPPTLTREGELVRITHGDRDALRAYVIYERAEGDAAHHVARIVPATSDTIELDGTRDPAVSAADRRGIESLARRLP